MAQAMFSPQRILTPKAIPFKLATWNIKGGLHSDEDSASLFFDLQNLQVDVACLQETHRSYVTILHPAHTGNAPLTPTTVLLRIRDMVKDFIFQRNGVPTFTVSNRISVINLTVTELRGKLHGSHSLIYTAPPQSSFTKIQIKR